LRHGYVGQEAYRKSPVIAALLFWQICFVIAKHLTTLLPEETPSCLISSRPAGLVLATGIDIVYSGMSPAPPRLARKTTSFWLFFPKNSLNFKKFIPRNIKQVIP
jgi:hypothetical protein